MKCERGQKDETIDELYSYMTIGQTIIFVNSKRKAAELTKFLRGKGHATGILSSDLRKEERDLVMEEFRNNSIKVKKKQKMKVLVVTNMIARGIDVDTVTLVINYDLPIKHETKKIVKKKLIKKDFETYLHRVGRTGRMGKKGAAINLIGKK